MKVAPLWHAMRLGGGLRPVFVHTGQHYDPVLSSALVAQLGLPKPDHALAVGSGTHAGQTAEVMLRYDAVLDNDRPDLVIVVGDVNSTLAAALVARKRDIPVAHLEAGLRCGDRSMPEEINRLATDAIADILWTPSADADANLAREGVPADRITLVGNVMIDTLERMRPAIVDSPVLTQFGLQDQGYALATLHRPANVDDPQKLADLLGAIERVADGLPVILPAHPRTRARLEAAGFAARGGLRIVDAQEYVPFIRLVSGACFVLTDSGGVQEETSHLGVPCLTLRPSTERPVTLTLGTNQLTTPERLGDDVARILASPRPAPAHIPYWDGVAAGRVVADIRRRFLQGAE